MNFKDDGINSYLYGKSFSNSLVVKFDKNNSASYSRMEMLESIAKDKSVIHVGFADHIPLIKAKIESGYWLHKRLLEKSKICIGVDIDEEAVNYIKTNFDIKDIYALDIIKDQVPSYLCREWDLMILGEVLEHIDNPVLFLQNIHEKYQKYVKQFVVTVPNAFSFRNIVNVFKDTETINSDHRFWFSPYTLAKVATEAGFKIDSFGLGQLYMGDKWWKRKVLQRYPLLRENIIMQLNF